MEVCTHPVCRLITNLVDDQIFPGVLDGAHFRLQTKWPTICSIPFQCRSENIQVCVLCVSVCGRNHARMHMYM